MRKRLACRPVAAPLSPEWYLARQTGVGSSEAAEAVGRSQWRTPLELYLRKIGQQPEFGGNLYTRIGRQIEPLIKELFVESMAGKAELVPEVPPMMRSTSKPYMLASCDALVGDHEILECKWTQFADAWGQQGTDQIPEETILQVQHQMFVTGRRKTWVAVLVEAKFLLYFVDRHPDLIEWLQTSEGEFWDRVLDREPPSVDFDHKAALRAVRSLYGNQVEPAVAVHLSPESEKVRKRLAGLREAEKAIAQEIESCKAALLSEMGTAEFGIGFEGGALKRIYTGPSEFTVHREESITLKQVKNLPKRLILKAPDNGERPKLG